MISFRIIYSVLISLAFLLANTSCSRKQPVGTQLVERGKSNCAQSLNEVVSSIELQLTRLKQTTNVDEAESIGVELGQTYDAHPCEFFDQAILVDLTDSQIADIISILPVEFVDRPCESEKRLRSRLHSLDKVQLSAERLSMIRKSLQTSLARDKKMCSVHSPK